MSEKDRPFTVSDRRHFTPEGRARDEESTAPAPAPADVPVEPAPPSPTPGPASAAAHGAPPPPGAAVDFGQFLLSLGAQAGMLLGPTPADANAAEAVEGARQIITILEMLRDKTEARRTEEETRILDGLLFQLRLAYVERAKRP